MHLWFSLYTHTRNVMMMMLLMMMMRVQPDVASQCLTDIGHEVL